VVVGLLVPAFRVALTVPTGTSTPIRSVVVGQQSFDALTHIVNGRLATFLSPWNLDTTTSTFKGVMTLGAGACLAAGMAEVACAVAVSHEAPHTRIAPQSVTRERAFI
jgi:hypothetical protein